ncbi:AGAP009844-PA-like protein [Anopheles sinensis]|uniref:AGAP009844-PA-like protein n=1 Tax=Anopheles sinensis TaxID=74873 RepID=A0A084W8U9_ANOSI|nr:AGAP009844-PA-like protein [Anopheles sinensis]
MALRIYRGEETQRGEHPWAALLIYGFGRNRTASLCGGTLVSERYVITAAHCVAEQLNRKLLYVRFNEFNTKSKSNCTTDGDENICRYDYEVESVTSHPEYITGGLSNQHDIAFLKLAKDVSFDDYVRPICLPFEAEIQKLPIVNEYFTVTGWGETESKSLSTVQLHVELPGLNIEACNSAYEPSGITVTDRQLCVGGLNGSDSCRGDAGGPLMRQVRGVWYLVGIVSFGARNCGTVDFPGVYTNVIRYLDWIEKVMFVERYW